MEGPGILSGSERSPREQGLWLQGVKPCSTLWMRKMSNRRASGLSQILSSLSLKASFLSFLSSFILHSFASLSLCGIKGESEKLPGATSSSPNRRSLILPLSRCLIFERQEVSCFHSSSVRSVLLPHPPHPGPVFTVLRSSSSNI